MPAHKETIKVLLMIVSNLISKPLDPQVRQLKKSNKSVQQKVLQYKNAVRFLKLVGFDFDQPTDII